MARIYQGARTELILWDGTEEAFLAIRQKMPDNKMIARGTDLIAAIVTRPPEQVFDQGGGPVRNAMGQPESPEAVTRGRVGEWAVFDPSTPLEVEFLTQAQVDRKYPEQPTR